jgi:hypothetical protein
VKAGNPVWPFLYSIFGGKYWSADQSARWAAYGGEHLIAPGFVAACLQKLGVLLSVSRSADVFAGWLPIASVAALLWRRKSFFPGALSTAAPAVVAYTAAALFCGPPSARYFAPVFPWVAAGLASALESLRERRKVGAAAWTILAVVSLYTSPLTDGRIWRKAQVSFGLDSPQTELARLDVYAPSVWINGHLPPTAKILLLNDIRGFYLDRDYLWGDPVNQAAVSYDGVSDLSSLLVRWRAVGVTHVLFREGGLFWPADGAGAVRDFLTKVHPVVVVGGYILYEVP